MRRGCCGILVLLVMLLALPAGAVVDEELALRTEGVPYRWDGRLFRVPLLVRDNSGMVRRAWPLSSGVPLPRGVVRDPTSLRVTDEAGRVMPCQFEPLSRYWALDGSLRWVLLHCQLDLPAGGERRLWLSNDGPAHAALPPIRVEEAPGEIRVDTGPLQVRIGGPALLREVRLGGRVILRGEPGDGPYIRSGEAPYYERFRGKSWNPAGWEKERSRYPLRLREAEYRAGPPTQLKVERRGPLHLVVRLHGAFRPAEPGDGVLEGGLYRWTARLHLYAGKPWILVQYDIENSGRERPQAVHPFVEAGLRWRLEAAGQGVRAAAGGWQGGELVQAATSLGPREVLRLHQRRGRDGKGRREHARPGGFQVLHIRGDGPGRELAAGGRARWLAAAAGGGAVTVAMRYFWELAPRALAVDGAGRLVIQVHARPKGLPYDLDLGERSIHDVLLAFGRTMPEPGQAADLAEAFEYPLFAWAPPAWYSHTEAWYFELAPDPARPRRRGDGHRHWRPKRVGYRQHGRQGNYNSGGHHESLNSAWLSFIRTGSLTELERQRVLSRWAIAHNPGWIYEGNVLRLEALTEAALRELDRQIAAWGDLAGFGPKDFLLWRSGRTRTARWGGKVREQPEGGWSYLNGYKVLPDHEHYAFFRLFEYWYLTGELRALDAIHGFVNGAVYYQHRHLFRGRTRPLSDTTLFERDPEALWRGHYARVYTWMLYTTLAGYHATGSPVFDLFARWQLRRALLVLRHRRGQLTRIPNSDWRRGVKDPVTGRMIWESRAKTWMEAQGPLAFHEAWKTYRDPLILDALWAQADYFAHHVVFYPRLAMINRHTAMPNAWLGSAPWTISPQRHDRVIQALPLLYHYAPWSTLAERYRAFAEAVGWRWVRPWFTQTLAWERRVRPREHVDQDGWEWGPLRARREGGWLHLRLPGVVPGRRYLVRVASRPIVGRAPADHPARVAGKAQVAREVEERAAARLGLERARKRWPHRFAPLGIQEPRQSQRHHPGWFTRVAFWAASQAVVRFGEDGTASVPLAAFRRHEELGGVASGLRPERVRWVCVQDPRFRRSPWLACVDLP